MPRFVTGTLGEGVGIVHVFPLEKNFSSRYRGPSTALKLTLHGSGCSSDLANTVFPDSHCHVSFQHGSKSALFLGLTSSQPQHDSPHPDMKAVSTVL